MMGVKVMDEVWYLYDYRGKWEMVLVKSKQSYFAS